MYILVILLLILFLLSYFNIIENKYSNLVKKSFLLFLLILTLVKLGPLYLLVFIALLFAILSMLTNSIDVNNIFKFLGGVELGEFNYRAKSTYDKNTQIEIAEAAKVLGISEDASEDQVISAHKELIARFHPDKVGGSEYFSKKINQSRDVMLKKIRKQ